MKRVEKLKPFSSDLLDVAKEVIIQLRNAGHKAYCVADFTEAVYNLGVVYTKQKKDAEAEAQFLRVLRLRPGLPEAHFNLGVTYERRGRRKNNRRRSAPWRAVRSRVSGRRNRCRPQSDTR